MRSGRTIDFTKREAQHLRDPVLKVFQFDPVFKTNTYAMPLGFNGPDGRGG